MDVDDQVVVQQSLMLELINDLSILDIGMLQVSCKYFHQADLKLALGFRDVIPFFHALRQWIQDSILRNPSQFLLLLDGHASQHFPTFIKFAVIFISPLLENM